MRIFKINFAVLLAFLLIVPNAQSWSKADKKGEEEKKVAKPASAELVLKTGSSEIVTLDGKIIESNVVVNWQTLLEENNEYFQLERFTTQEGAKLLDQKINSFGRLDEIKNYQIVDDEPLEGESLYRLHLVDKNGKVRKSEWVTINFRNDLQVNLFPSPSIDDLTLRLSGINEQVKIIMMNDEGKTVLEKTVKNPDAKIEDIDLESKDLPEGIYTLIIRSRSKNITKKIHINR